ncbi:MAG: family 10 glycosylhydrolase [Patescibacteria group bacterium]
MTFSQANTPTIKGMWFSGIDFQRTNSESELKSELQRLEQLGFSHVYINVNPGCTIFDFVYLNQNLKCSARFYQKRDYLREVLNNTKMKVIAWNEYGYLTPQSHPVITKDPSALLRTSSGKITDSKSHSWLDPFNTNVHNYQKQFNEYLNRNYPKLAGIQYDDHFGFHSDMRPQSTKGNSQDIVITKFTKIISDILVHAKTINPNWEISISPGDIMQSKKYYHQDSIAWSNLTHNNSKLINYFAIQAYRQNMKFFLEVINRTETKTLIKSGTPVVVAISYMANGEYLTDSLIRQQATEAKKTGFRGVALFHNLGFKYKHSSEKDMASRNKMLLEIR